MIHSFNVNNYYSIGSQIGLVFTSPKSKIHFPDMYKKDALEQYVSLVTFIGGKNSSGKTNILRSLSFLAELITKKSSPNSKTVSMRMPFLAKPDKPTYFNTQFAINQSAIYDYSISFDSEKIIEEILNIKQQGDERKTNSLLFQRTWIDGEYKYEIKINSILKLASQTKTIKQILDSEPTTTTIQLLHFFETSNEKHLRGVLNFWSTLHSNIYFNEKDEADASLTALAQSKLDEIAENTKLLKEVSKILKKFDIGFTAIEKRISLSKNTNSEHILSHSYDDSNIFNLSLKNESNGTKKMIVLLYHIVNALNSGGTAVIDEFEAYLHPDIVEYIIELFLSKYTNPNSAQLILSSHNYALLNKFEKEQIILTDKNNRGSTEAWKLSEMEGIRNDANFSAQYETGYYGGKPNLRRITA